MTDWLEKNAVSITTRNGSKKGSYSDGSLEENGLLSYDRNKRHLGEKNDVQIRLEGLTS